ncbi:hypothetical protein [Nocardioides antri]|uniref:Lipoprotein n=1 Tax=Nocardioides antri TaxID=2607659 RepID=A0A5B1M2A9_9ACTN|nr:hypothetical protein [Nocardioides antri]KAA1425890.1 hypothetical protein F0U47_16225 [Nocardioides antri]
MTRVLLLLTLSLALTACGDEAGDSADDAASVPPSATPSSDVGEPEVITILSGSAAGGEVAEEATPLEDEQDITRYVEQFESPSFAADLADAVRVVPLAEGRVAGAAVIAIGCDVPSKATVTEEDGAFVVTPGKIVKPHQECYAPVTSVAVLDLPVR